MLNATRQADEYLTAQSLSDLGFGPVDRLQARLRGIDDDKLFAIIEWCQDPNDEDPFDLPDPGDWMDWVYEVERERRAGIEDLNVLSAYEQRVNRGAYE